MIHQSLHKYTMTIHYSFDINPLASIGSKPKRKERLFWACTRKATTGRKSNTRACREDLMTLVLGFLQYNVMASEPEMYKCIYLGLIEREREVDIEGLEEEACLIVSCNIFLYDLTL
jgi:hypothetical protein